MSFLRTPVAGPREILRLRLGMTKSSPAQSLRLTVALRIGLILLTLGYWATLIVPLELFASEPGWFWIRHLKPLPWFRLILPLAALACLAAYHVNRFPRRQAANLLLLVLLGYCLQMGFGLMEGRGIDGVRDRVIKTGHAGFAVAALQAPSMSEVASRYESLLSERRIPFYPCSTKPPGQLLFYMLTERISRPFAGLLPRHSSPLDRLRTFATWFFPLLSYLTLIPLLWLSRMLIPERQANHSLLLYLFVPSVTLMTLHLDQCLYPPITVTAVAFFALALKRRSILPALVSGALLYLGLFVSFSLVSVLAVTVIGSALSLLLGPHSPDRKSPFSGFLRTLGFFVLGFLALYVFLRLVWHYEPMTRYRNAMLFHQQWKLLRWDFSSTVRYGFLNMVEFAFWTGLPAMFLFLSDLFRSARAGLDRKLSLAGAFSLSLFASILLMALFGRTVGEAARLWLFIVPLVLIPAARELHRTWNLRKNLGVAVVVLLQLLTILIIKRYQDFF